VRPFTIHWSPVPGAPGAKELFALWPSPVNDDACFREAGFCDFADSDSEWDANADALLTRLIEALTNFGAPHLVSKPVLKYQPWYRRLFIKAEIFDLRQQIELPIQWDGLPDCIVDFGESGVSLRSGSGHHLFWITLPGPSATSFPQLLGQVAASHPTVCTELKWESLL
jgi:hypothetical protein